MLQLSHYAPDLNSGLLVPTLLLELAERVEQGTAQRPYVLRRAARAHGLPQHGRDPIERAVARGGRPFYPSTLNRPEGVRRIVAGLGRAWYAPGIDGILI